MELPNETEYEDSSKVTQAVQENGAPHTVASVSESINRDSIERDTILLLGRRAAGKTVYLAKLYAKLYEGHNGLFMKALRGPDHLELQKTQQLLLDGEWPGATIQTRQMAFELDHQGERRLMIAQDYNGEDFAKAFLEEQMDDPGVRALLNALNRAAAVVILLDPRIALSGRFNERAEDDFGMEKAVEHIRGWSGGDKVPIIIAFSKADRHSKEIKAEGGVKGFALKHYASLMRTLGDVPIVAMSAVQEYARSGFTKPHPRSVPRNVEIPILMCLQRLQRSENQAANERLKRQIQEQIALEEAATDRAERRQTVKFWVWFWVLVILAFGASIAIPLYLRRHSL